MTVAGEASTTPASTNGDRENSAGSRPVILLTYGYSGAQLLRELLDSQGELACTAGTGVLPACAQVAAAWRLIENRPEGSLSTLAAVSIRKLAAQMIMVIAAQSGRQRWCETAVFNPNAAETFLRVFPAAKFICLHRGFPELASALVQANPWGLASPSFAPYVSAYPYSTAAALASWWVQNTGPLLEFEDKHPKACMRVRFEDVSGDPASLLQDLRAFLDLTATAPGFRHLLGEPTGTPNPGDGSGAAVPFPIGQLPPDLASRVDQLHAQIGYSPLAARQSRYAAPAPQGFDG